MQNMSAVIDDSNPSKEIDVTTPAALSSLDKIYIYTTLMFWIKKYFVVAGSLTDCSHQGEGGRVISVRIVFFSFSSAVFRQAFFMKKKMFFQTETKFSSVSITAGWKNWLDPQLSLPVCSNSVTRCKLRQKQLQHLQM